MLIVGLYNFCCLLCSQGSPGDRGPAGSPGADGAPGERGDTGLGGTKGEKGLKVSNYPASVALWTACSKMRPTVLRCKDRVF